MNPMTTAADGQARLCVCWEDCRKRPQPEQQNQENGEYTPHRRFFVYGNQVASVKFGANARRQRTSDCCVIHSTYEKDSLCPKSTYHVRRNRFPHKAGSVAPALGAWIDVGNVHLKIISIERVPTPRMRTPTTEYKSIFRRFALRHSHGPALNAR